MLEKLAGRTQEYDLKLSEAEAPIAELKRELFGPKADKLTAEQEEQLQALNVGITPSLDPSSRMSGNPHRLAANEGQSFIGSYVLGTGFLLEPQEAQDLITKDPRNEAILFPYLNGENLNSRWDFLASRWVIDFNDWPIERAMEYQDVFAAIN